MIRFLSAAVDFLKKQHKSPEQKYLEGSHDVYDLERRLKLISRGQAPYQLRYRVFSSNMNTGR